jgi:hypothetical protein
LKSDKKQLPILIRDADPSDVSFIFNSWLKSYRNGHLCRGVDNTIYYAEHHKLIERILKTATVKIACDPKDIATIYGYICYEKIDGIFVAHFAYTKNTFRSLGVLTQLIKEIDHDFAGAGLFTHRNDRTEFLAAKYHLIYHPYILTNYNITTPEKSSSEVK